MFQTFIESDPDMSERVRDNLIANANRTRESYKTKMLYQRGMQVETYKTNIYNQSLKTKKETLSGNASFIRKDDAGSFLPFDQNIADIKTEISKRGVSQGTAEVLPKDAKSWSHLYRDGDGEVVKVKMSDSLKMKVAKEVGEGIAFSIKSMSRS